MRSLLWQRPVPSTERVVEIVILWGEHSVLHASHVRPGQRFVFGDPQRTELAVDFTLGESALGAPQFVLLDSDPEGDWHLQLPPGAQGSLVRASALSALAPDSRVRVQPNDAFGIEWQGLEVQVRELESADVTSLAAGNGFKLSEHRWTLGSLGLHGLFLLLFQLVPSAASSLNLDESARESRLVRTYLEALSVEPPEPLFTPDVGHDAEGGERAAEDEGQAGSPKHKPTGKVSSGAAQPQSTAPSRDELAALASQMGINQVLRTAAGPTANLFSDRPEGVEEGAALLGAITGDLLGENFGFGGRGALGTGRGGGGPARGTIGVGGVATRGGISFGTPVALGGGPPGRAPTIRRLTPEVMGGLSREVIRREIGRHLNEVRHCYEEGLRSRPELEGRVTVKFAIDPTGSVVSAGVAQDGLGAPSVALCIGHAVKRWRFPAPEGSGTVIVSYPFLLQRT